MKCAALRVRVQRIAAVSFLALGASACSATHETAAASTVATAPDAAAPAVTPVEATPGQVDLLPLLREGAIDDDGPVVDLGEPQSAAYLQTPTAITTETVNGDSWASFGSRLRLRVPIDITAPPTSLRVRVRHARARSLAVLVDGLLARAAVLPVGAGASTLSLTIPPDRFRREQAEIELRFVGVPRGLQGTGTASRAPSRVVVVRHGVVQRPVAARRGRPVRAGRRTLASRRLAVTHPVAPAPAPQPLVDVDWIHLARSDVAPVRVSDLVSDVRADGPPRRALTLYAPSALSIVTVVPPHATLHAALSAEGIRGGSAERAVTARVRVETDDAPPLELRERVVAGASWRDVSLDLGPLAGKAARITVRAEEGGDTRLAIAEPRLVTRTDAPPAAPPSVRHVLFIVVQGARTDRFLPALSPRFTYGGFARLMREGLFAQAVAPSSHGLAALASAVTGIPADQHGMTELTDTLDDAAPTLGGTLHEAGIATAGFSDDRWWEGSGLDRGYGERGGCAPDVALCRAESALVAAAEWLTRQREHRAFALVITRAGAVPFDPAPDLLDAIDHAPAENAITPEKSAELARRSRHGALALEPRETERLAALYDAAMAGVDRGLNTALDRLRDGGMDRDTAVILTGDRGSALGESGLVGEGPMSLAVSSHTVLMVRAPGVATGTLGETASVLDAAATVLERLAATPVAGGPGDRAGAVSIAASHGAALHPRGVVLVANARGGLGLRFGELLALGRPGGLLELIDPSSDPLGQRDVSVERPIALAFAQTALGLYRTTRDDGAPPLPEYAPSTRALPTAVEAALRTSGVLER